MKFMEKNGNDCANKIQCDKCEVDFNLLLISEDK